jgi:c-di-GMP phosphodiesterase
MVLGENTFINRIPVLDIKSTISAYEIEFFGLGNAGKGPTVERIRLGSSLAAILKSIEPQRLVGDRKAVVSTELNEFGFATPEKWRGRLILQVPSSVLFNEGSKLPDWTASNETAFCITDVALVKGLAPIPSAPCFVKINIQNLNDKELSSAVKALKASPITVIATRVDSREDFDRCARAGIDLFLGDFFTKPVVSKQKSISPTQALLLELSAKTNQNADIRVIETIFKKNPDLAFGLMNLVHSAYYRVSEHVASMRQAIALLGYENLHKWVALMLFSIERSTSSADPLFEKALVRARTMELAATKLRQKGLGSSAYITGIFSLIPALFDVSVEEILTKANFVDEIKRALLQKSGAVGELLAAVEEIEKGGHESLPIGRESGLQNVELFKAHSEAIMEYPISSEQTNAEPARTNPRVSEMVHSRPGVRARATSNNGQSKTSWIGRLLTLLGFGIKRGSPA